VVDRAAETERQAGGGHEKGHAMILTAWMKKYRKVNETRIAMLAELNELGPGILKATLGFNNLNLRRAAKELGYSAGYLCQIRKGRLRMTPQLLDAIIKRYIEPRKGTR